MKEEEIDWLVYHSLLEDSSRCRQDLMNLTGCGADAVEASLLRLASAMLIEIMPDGLRIISLQEMLIRCQCRYDRQSPLVINGGVLTIKKPKEQQDD